MTTAEDTIIQGLVFDIQEAREGLISRRLTADEFVREVGRVHNVTGTLERIFAHDTKSSQPIFLANLRGISRTCSEMILIVTTFHTQIDQKREADNE